MTFEGLLIVPIYIWLPPASYVVFLTTLVHNIVECDFKQSISLTHSHFSQKQIALFYGHEILISLNQEVSKK